MARQRNSLALTLSFVILIAITGCDPQAFTQGGGVENVTQTNNTNTTAPDMIIVGSFNIETFGRSKFGNASVMSYLVDIVRRFDVIAIQELRDVGNTVIPGFIEMLNQDGAEFAYVIGPQQGTRYYSEQYVYIYDANKLEVTSQPFVVTDPTNEIDRPPFAVNFRCKHVPADQAFTFTLMNIHTDPDEIKMEIPALRNVVAQLLQTPAGQEDDLIMLGDFNAPPRHLQTLPWFQNQYPAIHDDWSTNTRMDRGYDNIIFDAVNTSEFLSQSGVLNMMTEYGLAYDDAKQISDHMPVWAVFSTRESNRGMLTKQVQPNVDQFGNVTR